MPIVSLMEWCACGLFAAAAVTDLRRRRVPNAIPLSLAGLFAVYAAAGAVRPPAAAWEHLAIAAALLAAGFALYLTGRFGAGDAKLIAAAGLWAGPGALSLFLFGLGAGAFALVLAALLPFEAARRWRAELPFAVAVVPAAAAVLVPRALHPLP